jgi:hypothetical protein
VLSAALLVAVGGLVAADRRWPLVLVVGFAVACGLVHGCFNGAALAGESSGKLAVVGLVSAVFVVVAIVAGQVAWLRVAWARVVVRVLGSWIGAIGLLLLGWATRRVA